MHFQLGAQILIAAVDRISDHPGERDLCKPQTLDHLPGLLAFGLEAHDVGNPCLLTVLAIFDPAHGKIEFAIQERLAFRASVSEEHPDLAIFQVACRAAMLSRHSRRFFAAFAKTRFVDHQDGVRIAQVF